MAPLVLSVDDEPDITDLACLHLRRAGYDVLTASSGRQALETVQTRHPDLVLLDLMLPDIDGFSVCEILRSDPATAAIPVIIISAWSTREARAMGFECGGLDYVTKPFSPQELIARVKRLLSPRPPPA